MLLTERSRTRRLTTTCLVNDIINSSTPSCINISANNITLDCQGHLIDGDDVALYGIYNFRKNYTTLKNCRLSDWNTTINFYDSNYLNITNMTASSNGDGLGSISLDSVTYSNIINNTIEDSDNDGIFCSSCEFCNFTDNEIKNSDLAGIELTFSSNNTITFNIIETSLYESCIYITTTSSDNNIYNNLLNCSIPILADDNYANSWNTTKQNGTRIYSNGTQIGGNYYTNSTGNGYSDICTDSDNNGFCDEQYNFSVENIDYLPLSNEYEEASDTCTYTSGNWEVDCSDNCKITTNYDLGGNNLTLEGTGTFKIMANITDIGLIIKDNNCEVIKGNDYLVG